MFWFITRNDLQDTVYWEMHNNNFIVSTRRLWCQHGCIPMGGSFCAQVADLHSLWHVYQFRHLFRRLGTLHVNERGFVYWRNVHRTVSLRQFKENTDQTASQRLCGLVVTLKFAHSKVLCSAFADYLEVPALFQDIKYGLN